MSVYSDKKISDKIFVRTFDKDVLAEELIWHHDRSDRTVKVLEGEGWEIQFENQLPRLMKKGEFYRIPAYVYHRIKRGKTDLVLEIYEDS